MTQHNTTPADLRQNDRVAVEAHLQKTGEDVAFEGHVHSTHAGSQWHAVNIETDGGQRYTIWYNGKHQRWDLREPELRGNTLARDIDVRGAH